ncbi:MAG: hypothetical protein H5T71_05675, partial [Chloroflexi bacterium]|nr:hypothetical protein [Chloroflexota bacterium]
MLKNPRHASFTSKKLYQRLIDGNSFRKRYDVKNINSTTKLTVGAKNSPIKGIKEKNPKVKAKEKSGIAKRLDKKEAR